MNIKLHEIYVRDLVSGYADSGDEGVVGYDGKLDIRPAYQREFIYKDRQREAVVDSVMHGFPLNVMYWAKRGDGTFEVMDGQQRTISLCQYAAGDFSSTCASSRTSRTPSATASSITRLWSTSASGRTRRSFAGFLVPWGLLYNKFAEVPQDPKTLEARIAKLVADSDVQKKSGIWEYVLDGDERHLGIRAFDDNTRLEAYERQHGVCPLCGAHFELNEMEADHITPWRDGGRTIPANCQMLCRDCNRRKGAK